MKTLLHAFGFALLAAAVMAGTAGAYVLDTDGNGHNLHWNRSVVRYRMVSGNAPGGAAAESAIHNAFRAWSNATPNLSYQFDGFVPAGIQAYDNQNLVYWVYSGWTWDPTLLAITFRFFDKGSGRLLDADIVFNAQRYTWSTGGSAYDIENSAAHEVGHFSGLGHSGDSEATMYASARVGETKKRTLAGDDVAGLSALYGGSTGTGGAVTAPAAGGGGGGGGGCSIGRTGVRAGLGDLLWTGMLLAGLALRRRRSGRCVNDGALSAFGGAVARVGSVSGVGGRGARVQHERSAGKALLGARHHDRVLGPGL